MAKYNVKCTTHKTLARRVSRTQAVNLVDQHNRTCGNAYKVRVLSRGLFNRILKGRRTRS